MAKALDLAKVEIVEEREDSSELQELQDLLEQNNKLDNPAEEQEVQEVKCKPDIEENDQNYKPSIENFKSPASLRAPSKIQMTFVISNDELTNFFSTFFR